MSLNQTQINTTVGIQKQGLVGLVVVCLVTTVPCFVCLFINGVMLFTLRSKPVFQETSRYILLFNLLLVDTVQLAYSQTMFLLSAGNVKLLYPLCAVLTAFYSLPHGVSLLTLILMCLERYVAVCFPLRHAVIVTIRNTSMAISLVWTAASLSSLVQMSLVVVARFADWQSMENMQMKDFCGKDSLYQDRVSHLYDTAVTYVLFVLASLSVTFSYFGIIVAAKSASTDKVSAKKAQRTLLLHLIQLGLTMSSTIHGSLLILASNLTDRLLAINIQIILYICLVIAPKCLSSLIYGLRDQTIRPVLLLHLSCRCTVSPGSISTSTRLKILTSKFYR